MVFKKSVFFDCPLFLPKNVKNQLKFWSGKDQEKKHRKSTKNRPKIINKSMFFCQKLLENAKNAATKRIFEAPAFRLKKLSKKDPKKEPWGLNLT